MASSLMQQVLKFSICFLVVAGGAYWTVLPLCGLIYGCGCTFESGIRFCNIFEAGQPHCPWCRLDPVGFWSLFGVNMALTAPVVWIGLSRFRNSVWVGLGCGAAAYLLWVSLLGSALAFYLGYPTLYGLRIG